MKGKIIGLVEFKRREKSNKRLGQRQHFKFLWTEEKSSNGAFYYTFSHMHASASHTHTVSNQATTGRPPHLLEWHPSPDTPQPGRVGFHGGGMLHHLVHRHHQEDDIDLSKQTRITVNRLHLERHPISAANTEGGGRERSDHWKHTITTEKPHHFKK